MRDYRFIALTFLVGVICGLWFAVITQGKHHWLGSVVVGVFFLIWAFALFAYMRSETEKTINIYGDTK